MGLYGPYSDTGNDVLARMVTSLGLLIEQVMGAAIPADESVTDAKVADDANIAQAKIAGLVADLAARATDAELSAVAATTTVRVANAQTVDYTLVLTDAGKAVEINAVTGKNVTIPPNASVAFPVGTIIEVPQVGAGAVTLVAGAGVTITGDTVTPGQGGSLLLRKTAMNTWWSAIWSVRSGTYAEAAATAAALAAKAADNAVVKVTGDQSKSGLLSVLPTIPTSALASLATGANPSCVVIQNNYAYLAVNGLVKIIDVSIPGSPAIVSQVDTGTQPLALTVKGRTLYVVDYTDATLKAVDITNPFAPSVIGSVATRAQPHSVTVEGGYAYLSSNGTGYLEIFRVTDPATMFLYAELNLSATNSVYVSVQNGYAFVAGYQTNKFYVVNITNPQLPVLVAAVTTPGRCRWAQAEGAYLYVVEELTDVMRVWNITNPAVPVEVSSISVGSQPHDVLVHGGFAYVACLGAGRVDVIDVRNPAVPVAFGQITTGAQPANIAVSGSLMLVPCFLGSSLQVFSFKGIDVDRLDVGGMAAGDIRARKSVTTRALDVIDGATIGGPLDAQRTAVRTLTVRERIRVHEGTNRPSGVVTLVAGTATVPCNIVTAVSRIQLSVQSLGTVAAPKAVAVTSRSPGASFTISSADATDTSVVHYVIVEPQDTGLVIPSPGTIAGGPVFWVAADSLSGVLADGVGVASFPDLAAIPHNPVQATGGKQPLFKTGILNSLPVLRFDGVDDRMKTAAFTLNQPFTRFCVAKLNATTNNAYILDGNAINSATLQRSSGGLLIMYAGVIVGTVAADTSWHITSGVLNGASSNLRIDGGAGVSGNVGAVNAGGVTMGSSGNDTLWSSSDIAEVIYYTGALSLADMNVVGAYLAAKYALTWATAT